MINEVGTYGSIHFFCFLPFLLYICRIESKNEKYETATDLPGRNTRF